MTVSLVQNRKTIPAEGSAACVVAPECSVARSKSVRSDTNRVFGKEASPLDANFLQASFLGHRSRDAHQESKNRRHFNCQNHLPLSLPVLDFLHNDKSNSIYADSPDILLFEVGWN